MKGHIRKRGSGYQIIVDLGRDPLTGKRKQKAQGGFKTKKEAEKALAELIIKIEKGEYFDSQKISMKEYLEKWLEIKKPLLKPTTYLFYERIVNNVLIPNLGKMQLDKLKPLHLQSFFTELLNRDDINSTTVKHYYTTLKTALNQAVKLQLIPSNPCDAIEPPKRAKSNKSILDLKHIFYILEYAQNNFETMYIPLLLAITCGLRHGEILALKWSNVDLEKGLITITENAPIRINGENYVSTTKTSTGKRAVKLLPFTIPILKQHKRKQLENKLLFGKAYINSDLVCCWPNGEEIRPDYITHTFKKILKKCNLPENIRFHDLRHTHATLMLLAGINPKAAAERMGHASTDFMLDTYSHLLPTIQDEAVEKLNNLFISHANTDFLMGTYGPFAVNHSGQRN